MRRAVVFLALFMAPSVFAIDPRLDSHAPLSGSLPDSTIEGSASPKIQFTANVDLTSRLDNPELPFMGEAGTIAGRPGAWMHLTPLRRDPYYGRAVTTQERMGRMTPDTKLNLYAVRLDPVKSLAEAKAACSRLAPVGYWNLLREREFAQFLMMPAVRDTLMAKADPSTGRVAGTQPLLWPEYDSNTYVNWVEAADGKTEERLLIWRKSTHGGPPEQFLMTPAQWKNEYGKQLPREISLETAIAEAVASHQGQIQRLTERENSSAAQIGFLPTPTSVILKGLNRAQKDEIKKHREAVVSLKSRQGESFRELSEKYHRNQETAQRARAGFESFFRDGISPVCIGGNRGDALEAQSAFMTPRHW